MHKAELITALAESTNSTKGDTEDFIDSLQEIIMNAVANGEKVTLTGFGSWDSVEREARDGRNPQTGETIHIPSKVVPRFKFGKCFKDIVAAKQSSGN